MKKSRKFITFILIMLISAYVGYAIYLLIMQPVDTYIIKQGTLSEEDEATGYIIRKEEVIKEENYTNGIYAMIAEGEKVAKSDSIFRYYSDNEREISNKITEINHQIQEILKDEKNLTSADIKSIENQIEEQIKNIRALNNSQEIAECKNNIDSLISKKINFIGDIVENEEVKKLIEERKKYEEKIKNGTEYKKAPISGIVSYRVDGFEEQLSVDRLNELTEEYLSELDLKTGQLIATNNDCGKVIDNFKCYIAITMNSEKAMSAEIGDIAKIRTSNREEIKAKIVQINEEDGKRTIIFQTDKIVNELINYRKILLDVIWWSESGLKVPNKALIEEDGLNYVIRTRAGKQTKILVKVKAKTEKFSIITSYTTKELQNIGYNEDDIKNYKGINNYDEIMLNLEE